MTKAHDTHGCTCPSGDGSLRWPCPMHPALLPCPFCGASASGYAIEPHQHSTALLALVPDMPKEHRGSYVIEGDCQCESGLIGANQAEVTARWNARAPLKTAGEPFVALGECIADQVCLSVAELPDRDSPVDWPQAMLVTSDELRNIVLNAINYAAQAVEAQVAPAAPDTNRLRAEIQEHASKGSRLVRTLFNEPAGTLSDVEVGDWIQRAQQYLTLPSHAEPFGYANVYTGQFFHDVEPCRKNDGGHWRTVYTAPQAQPADALKLVRQAIRDYHYALDTRQHGGVAADAAISSIERKLDMPWKQGEESARRSASPVIAQQKQDE